MSTRSIKGLLLGVSLLLPLGCQPAPVVVNPDGDDDTTVVEERDVVIDDKGPALPSPDSGTDVHVDVGGGKGVDVDVDKNDNSNP